MTCLRSVLGCTLAIVGLANIGSAYAQHGSGSRFQPGDSLWVMLSDSTVIVGVFEDLGRIPAEQYRDRFDGWRKESAAGATLPDLGTPIELIKGRMWAHRGLFGGFALDGIEVSEKKGDSLETIEFSKFSMLTVRGGRRWMRQDLERMSLEEKVPLRTALQLRVDGEVRWVPIDDVVEVRSQASAPPSDPRAAFRARGSSAVVAIEVGRLWVDNSDAAATGLLMRVHPGPWNRQLGLDATVGILRDSEVGVMIGDLELAAVASIPLGTEGTLRPRVGFGALVGSGGGVATWSMGAGLVRRAGPGWGVRMDYKYTQLIASTEEWAANSIYIGPFWGR